MASKAGRIFPSEDEAAIAAIEEINPVSIARNIEFAGRIVERDTGFTFTPARTLNLKDNSDPGPKIAGSIGSYHTHSGEFEATDEVFSPSDKAKATLGKELSFFGTPRGRILKYTPIDLLPPYEQGLNPTGVVEILKFPAYNIAHERGSLLGRWGVDRPKSGDTWDVIFFADASAVWTQGTGKEKFVALGTGTWWTKDDNIVTLWRADLAEFWPLPLRPKKQVGAESTGARLVARKTEESTENPKSKFSISV